MRVTVRCAKQLPVRKDNGETEKMKYRGIQAALLTAALIAAAGCGESNTNSAIDDDKAAINISENRIDEEETRTAGGNAKTETGSAASAVGAERKAQAGTASAAPIQNVERNAVTAKEKDEIQTVTITAAGDCTFACVQNHGYDGSFHEYYDKKGKKYFFSGVREQFEDDDLTLINLECVLSDSNDRVEKKFNLKGKPKYTKVMTSSSVEAVSLGNNHSSDYGPQSLKDTRKNLDKAGILYGYNKHTAIYTTDQGVKVGMVSANLLYQTKAYEDYIRKGIKKLRRKGADIIVASCHWGIERDFFPTDYQQKTAHKIVKWGADLVLGCHPHVLQGIEYYKGKLILYSMGNFCFGGNSNPSDKDTMLFQQTFKLKNGKLKKKLNARIIPCRLSSVSDHNDYRPTIVKGDQKKKIIANMNRYSKPYSGVHFNSKGKLSIKKD